MTNVNNVGLTEVFSCFSPPLISLLFGHLNAVTLGYTLVLKLSQREHHVDPSSQLGSPLLVWEAVAQSHEPFAQPNCLTPSLSWS